MAELGLAEAMLLAKAKLTSVPARNKVQSKTPVYAHNNVALKGNRLYDMLITNLYLEWVGSLSLDRAGDRSG